MTKTLQVVLGVILLSGGVVLFSVSSEDSSGVRAQGGGSNYTTTWEARQYVNVRAHNEGTYAGPVTIGITKWHNETREGGQLVYQEDWSADVPTSNTITFDGSFSAFTKSSWIFGLAGGDISTSRPFTFTFTNSAVNDVTKGTFGRRAVRSSGNAADCVAREGNATCLTSTGAYGFSINQLGDGAGNWPVATGALIPSKWTVTGTIY